MMAPLQLTITPGIDRFLRPLSEIKVLMKDVLDIALIDFLMVSSEIKKYNETVNSFGSDSNLISLSVTELQYMDVFSQKLNHIVTLNELICETARRATSMTSHNDNAGFVFKLNYLQASVAAYEFLINVENLRQNLYNLHHQMAASTGLTFSESNYFVHLSDVDAKMARIKVTLNEIQEERYREAPIAIVLIEQEMRKISDLYTMASERFVLLWLIKHTQSSIDELLEEYNLDGYDQPKEDVELF